MGWFVGNCPFHCTFTSKEEAEKRLEEYRTLPGALDHDELIDMGMCIGYLEVLKQQGDK